MRTFLLVLVLSVVWSGFCTVAIGQNVNNSQLNVKAKSLSELFRNADSTLTEYNRSKSRSSSQQFSENLRKIPSAFDELKLAVGSDPSKQPGLHNLDILVGMGLKILPELRAEADSKNSEPFRARHMSNDSHAIYERINEELTSLTQEKPKEDTKKRLGQH